ncbi:leucine-rich repeat-containing protein ODA7 [Morus notabilis]|uniref:leucine-rich repeat-containing protein ODA7 n=1 Tax=Morus notabilis TaxID=981085 RepID=UPI000CED3312|nr:leucine-rich repeat-containing protein ODA7 [Morus notabilis]
MSPLSSDQVLKDNNTRDPSAIEALKLTHRALSDVSFLCDFKNLARLDLRLNKLTSLEGLKLCTNLKWLSVAENKLESLKGIEALSKLTVFNAGKNKLKSMEEVRSITSLCALILNDNEISSICGLDKMKHLNTLVLSKNPIGEIGDSLLKLKSITKLSLSYCQLQNIGTSLKSCVELKELRLAHNDIKSLPAELVHNKDLQNLDLGYNVITRWSDLKVLDSFANLRSLNLQGNPIAANEKLVKKIGKILPNLCVFNSKPIEKYAKNEKGDKIVNDSSLGDKNLETQTEHKRDRIKKKDPIDPVMDEEMDANLNSVSDFDTKKKSKGKKLGSSDNALEVLTHEDEKRDEVKKKKSKHHLPDQSKIDKLENDPVSEKQPKQKSEVKNEKLQKRKGSFKDENDADAKKKAKKISTVRSSELDVIDESDALLAELLAANNTERPKYEEEKVIGNASQAMKSASGVVALSGKRKKAKSQGSGSVPELPPVVEVGLGGTSTWGDE